LAGIAPRRGAVFGRIGEIGHGGGLEAADSMQASWKRLMPTQERPVLLIVEDDPGLQRQMRDSLERYELVFADSREGAIAALRRHEPAVVTLDLRMPPESETPIEGFRTLADVLALEPATKVIVLTEREDEVHAARAIAMGATDLFEKPFDPGSLGVIIDRAFRVAGLERENRRVAESKIARGIGEVLTRDPAMLKLCRQIAKLASTSSAVLLVGESGTGKQLLAHALHDLSSRKPRRFVTVNCATLTDAQLELELFGEPRTRTADQPAGNGKIQLADGGTLFLDAVGELALPLQSRLLHALLQPQVAHSNGADRFSNGNGNGAERHNLDVRLVCATNEDLRIRIQKGLLREDLFYRLAEVSITVPPLRDRGGDATLLAHAFVKRYGTNHRRDRLSLTDGALNAIESHRWPGNVRELENCIKRAVIMSEGNVITAADLGLQGNSEIQSLNLRRIRDDAEKHAVLKVIARTDGNIARAAELLGVSRPTLYDLLNRFGLR
jgi:two-component system, NtrC family, response regulator